MPPPEVPTSQRSIAFARRLVQRLKRPKRPPVLHRTHARAAVAIVLRARVYGSGDGARGGAGRDIGGASAEQVIEGMEREAAGGRDVDLELLFIKRTERDGDRWSGQVAFPGGKQERGESDVETAVREAEEEVGLSLDDQCTYDYCGALDDLPVYAPDTTLILGISPHVFVQLQPPPHALRLEAAEVAAVQWTRLAFFLAVRPDISVLYHSSRTPDAVDRWLRVNPLRFTALLLPPAPLRALPKHVRQALPRGTFTPRAGRVRDGVVGHTNFVPLRSFPTPLFLLWGLTLSAVARLLSAGGVHRPEFLGRHVRTSNTLVNAALAVRDAVAARPLSSAALAGGSAAAAYAVHAGAHSALLARL